VQSTGADTSGLSLGRVEQDIGIRYPASAFHFHFTIVLRHGYPRGWLCTYLHRFENCDAKCAYLVGKTRKAIMYFLGRRSIRYLVIHPLV
jgi:hypothetical protein